MAVHPAISQRTGFLFNFGLKLLRNIFKTSRLSNQDPRVEILKHIAYGNQGAIHFCKHDPEQALIAISTNSY